MRFLAISLILCTILSVSCLAGEFWTDSEYISNNYLFSMAVFNNELYTATGTNNPLGESAAIYKLGNQGWIEAFRYDMPAFIHLHVFKDSFFASSSIGNVFKSFDGSDWSADFFSKGVIYSMEEYDGKLYGGDVVKGETAELVYYDGLRWGYSLVSFEDESIWDFEVFNGKLYIATGNGPLIERGHVYEFDGYNMKSIYFDDSHDVLSLKSFKGNLYAGLSSSGTVMVLENETWDVSYDSAEYNVNVLEIFDGKLYAGTDDHGYLLIFDGDMWSEKDITDSSSVQDLAVFKNTLYAGMTSTGEVKYQQIGDDVEVPELSMPGIILIVIIFVIGLMFFKKKYGYGL